MQCLIEKLSNYEEVEWVNPLRLPFEVTNSLYQLIVSDEDIEDAEKRLLRFAPFIKKCFPETAERGGLIESPLREIFNMQENLEKEYGINIPGKLYLKMDSHLAVAGSVKARGGIYEVLKHAEDLALAAGKISLDDNYENFATDEMRKFLNGYTMQVGSTGNLGMSIGIMSAALGFKVKIHMSADAKQWKKDLLRSRGVEVLEYKDDYSKAVAEGRKCSEADKTSYFVDDEKSIDLFLGYATAAKRLKNQLDEKNIMVDSEHPLVVYIPAGVGGAPGGIAYGLHRIFGDCVHAFFVETTTCPSVLLGIMTGKGEAANVRDYGISGITEADGLACASPSGFVTRIMTNIVAGEFTVSDNKLYDYLRLLYSSEDIKIEPSSCAAFKGACSICDADYNLNLENATQIVWATGGSMIPEENYDEYLNTYL